MRLKTIYNDHRVAIFTLGCVLLVGLGYLLYSASSRGLTVKLQTISEREALEIFTQATIEEYCAQFKDECRESDRGKLEANTAALLKQVIPKPQAGSGYTKLTYYHREKVAVHVIRLMSREREGPWATLENRREVIFLRQFPLAVSMIGRELPLQYKVRVALAKATVNHSAPFTIHPKEQKIWAVVNIERDRQFQAEYSKNGKTYVSGIFRAR